MGNFDLALFKRQLAETISWCSHPTVYADGKYAFRKFAFMNSAEAWLRCILNQDRNPCIQSMLEERTKLLYGKNISIPPLDPDLAGGRLLVLFPDDSLRDGYPAFESDDFFDMDDFPPQDTWIYSGLDYSPSPKRTRSFDYLLSWVPHDLFEPIENTIKMSSGEHILWLTDLESHDFSLSFLDLLKQEGLFI